MATEYKHVQLGVVDKNGDVQVLYFQNTGSDVMVAKDQNPNIPNNVEDLQDVVNVLGKMAFDNGDKILYLDETSEDYDDGQRPVSEINDDEVSDATTWSSKKLNTHCSRYIPRYEYPNSVDELSLTTKLFLTPTTFTIDGRDAGRAGVVPTVGYVYFVEYIPLVSSSDEREGQPGGVNVITNAIQRWTGHALSDADAACVRYTRVYTNNTWGTFNVET